MRKKAYKEPNVWEAAKERIRYLYKRFDRIVVSFSGGKDSTAVLHATLTVAQELGKLPLKVYFVDEEAIDPETIAYVARVRERPDVSLDWYCLPVKHRNACSLTHPFWYCWHPEERDRWVRPMPEYAITTDPAFEWGMDYQTWFRSAFNPKDGTVCVLTGIRTQESLRRYQVIASKRNDSYITSKADNLSVYRAHPIYDWDTQDVWTLIHKFGFDYNRAYDVFNRTEFHGKYLAQRICQPFGEEPLRSLDIYAKCFPEMWARLVNRVPGVKTAYRYAKTELYKNTEKPDGVSWEDWCLQTVEMQKDIEVREAVRAQVRRLIARHFRKTPDPIEETTAHPLSGVSWRGLAKIAARGDLKGRGEGNLLSEAHKRCLQLGITFEQATVLYGYGRSANQSGGVDPSGSAQAEPLQPERGCATRNGFARAEHIARRLDAADRNVQSGDSGRLSQVDGERSDSSVPNDGGPGADGSDSGRRATATDGVNGAPQQSSRRSRRAEDGRDSRGDVERGDELGPNRRSDGDGRGRSRTARKSEGHPTKQSNSKPRLVEVVATRINKPTPNV